MTPFTLDAPAKLNLSLRVLARRDDGFHEIDSLMVKLPHLADRLHFEPAASFEFACDEASLPSDDSNLVVKAVRAYQAATQLPCNCRISLEKHIPHAAGLGGGSSDAAATLIGLEQIHEGALGPQPLAALAAGLGSDVAFFLTPGAARCSGRGEIVEPTASPPALPVLLLKPAFAIATPEIYARWQTATAIPGVRYSRQEIQGFALVNDLEAPVFQKFRFLAELKQWLLARKEVAAALLCGSGSTVFAVLHPAADAQALAAAARLELDPGLWSWSGSTQGLPAF
ncbi:MAG: 4-(cytidine 5'-diphospho)-2-C-methyl-D-erythritol kinase [Verrucomicrobia bacterium]|nr:MAG: 4-(cytidine 5'-diphospho)-2-C-methyl-D-erythritol kinase [Verrucomicrobiota bacterium]